MLVLVRNNVFLKDSRTALNRHWSYYYYYCCCFKFVVIFMQNIYNYMPETTRVYLVYSVLLQCVLHIMLFHTWNMLCMFTLALSAACVQCTISLSFVVPWLPAFPVCCSGIDWIIVRWFLLLLFLLVSILLSHFTCAEFLLWGLTL